MTLWQDTRFATRLLYNDRWFTLAAVAALAFGIAANSTVFTMVNGVLLSRMPFDEPDRIVEFGEVSYPDFADYRAAVQVFDGLGATFEQTMNVSGEGVAAERFQGTYITSSAFRLIGVPPILGRDFTQDDERAGAAPVVILGHGVWRSRYNSDPGILGREIRVNGVPASVVGVMPEGFAFPQTTSVWQPMSLANPQLLADRRAAFLEPFGRLKSGRSLADGRADIQMIATRLSREYPDVERERPEQVAYYRSGVGTDTGLSRVFMFMLGAVAFVLVIACANVANLLLARSATRTREISVRLSIGASRWQVVRQLLVESALLAGVAGAVGFMLSVAGTRALWQVVLQTGDTPPYWLRFAIDWRVVSFCALACLGTTLLSGLAPAWLASQAGLVTALNESGRSTASRSSRRWTNAFIVAQLSLTLVLLSGAGVMVASLLAQVRADAGVDTSSLVALRFDLPASTYSTPDRRRALFRQFEDRLGAWPGARVTYANAIPMAATAERRLVTDRTLSLQPRERPIVGQMTVATNYFAALGVDIVRGRAFESRDLDSSTLAVVNQRFAGLYFPGEDPIGQRLRLLPLRETIAGQSPTDWLTVVGVAANVRQDSQPDGSFAPLVYLTVGANPLGSANVLVQSSPDLEATAALVRSQVGIIDPDLPLFNLRTVDEQLAFNRWPQRVFGTMFAIFAGIALLLGALGLYAVTAYAVAQRTKEIGVRVALGAPARQVIWFVIRTAAIQMAVGLILGGTGGVAISMLIPSQLVGTSTTGPAIFIAVAIVLVVAGAVACAAPVTRALRLNPIDALRTD